MARVYIYIIDVDIMILIPICAYTTVLVFKKLK